MLLTVDIGNTEVTLGLFEGPTLRRSFRVSSETRRTADEVRLLLQQAFPELAQGKAASIIGSVVPAQTSLYAEAARQLTQTEPLLVGPDTTAGVKIEYRDPGSVG